ncbi:SDR family oxidoreductase [Microbacterium sp. 179-I 3D2 NHS]|uniref:SDR family oxidoreductase n=1 Tax=Microbacterium sp. 179-I 3D2 NHS TaxID=3235178 RepID=UPI0039A0EDCE
MHTSVTPLLAGCRVFVSGGTAGVGAAIARAAARTGASAVTVSGRGAEVGEAIAAELSSLGADGRYMRTDLADLATTRTTFEEAVALMGGLDVLVNAAGLTDRGSILDTSEELFDRHVAVNLKAPFFLMQAAVEPLRDAGGGTIVNIISSAELAGPPHLAPYVAAKAGLAGLTKNVANALARDRIRVNGVDIGWTDTEGEDRTQRRFHGAGDDWRNQAGKTLPLGRLGDPDEIGDFVVFLASPRSGVVTGSIIDWDQLIPGAYSW